MSHPEDRELVRRMLGGDEEAFEAFGERFFEAVYRYSLSRLRGDREAARDTTQTTMTKALSKLHTYRGGSALLTWLTAICRNEILMTFRRRRSRPGGVSWDEVTEGDALPSLGPAAPEPRDDPEAAVLRGERSGLVHAVLASLRPRQAKALVMKYVERLSTREVAERLGVGEKAADSLLTRGRRAFQAGWTALLEGDDGGEASR